MSQTQTPPSPDAKRVAAGPGRFAPAPQGPDKSPLLHRVGAVAALLALVVGVPALLVWLSGAPPIPTRLPVREDFTQSLGIEQLLTVLVAIVWLAWLQFVVCLAVELLSAARHQGVPRPVPLSGPSQRLARVLVGALLLSSVVGGQVASVVSAVGSGPRADVTVSSTAQAGQGTAASGVSAAAVTAPKAGPPAKAATAFSAKATAAGVQPGTTIVRPDLAVGSKLYTVVTPVGHHHDSLWEIAQKHLGDGRRYKEIYELNKERIQPDGSHLHLARLIYPGWELVMPADAVGVATVIAQPVTPAPVPVAPASTGVGAASSNGAVAAHAGSATELDGVNGTASGALGSSATDLPGRVAGTASGAEQATPVSSPTLSAAPPQTAPFTASGQAASNQAQTDDRADVVAAPTGAANPFIGALSSGGIFAACVLIALARVRRRAGGGSQADGDALEAEVGLQAGADLDRTRWMDAALRGLGSRLESSGGMLPGVYAARLDDDELTLLVTPPQTDAPDPWTVHDDGRRWTLRRADLGRGGTSGPAAYPSLVAIGRDDDGTDVFVDLEAADGPVQISGDPQLAGQVAAALAVQLATLPWADRVSVSAVGLPADVAKIAGGVIDCSADVDTVVQRLEERASRVGDDVVTGRLSRNADGAAEYAVFTAPVDARFSGRLAAVTSAGRDPVGVIAVGELPGAQWQLQVDEAGVVRMPLLDLTVTAHRLAPSVVAALGDLFEAAAQAPAVQPARGLEVVPGVSAGQDDATFAVAPTRVGVLGPVMVRADGPLDPSRLPLAQEIVAYLAMHPSGVHPTVLASAIWPRGVGDSVATASVQRVRDWLGADADGSWLLRTDADGRYRLADAVACDWNAFRGLVGKARLAGSGSAESEYLRRALRLVRGEPFEGHPEHRYSWLSRTTAVRSMTESVVMVSHRLVELGVSGGDPDGAAAAAAAGLQMARTSQVLWRDVLEVEFKRGGPAAVRLAVDELRETLSAADVPLEPETEALVDHLLTGPSPVGAHGTA